MNAAQFYGIDSLMESRECQGVKIAIFDTSVSGKHLPIKKSYSWTKEVSKHATHGSFVAGIIASSNQNCPCICPKAEIYIHEMFDSSFISLTSNYLAAFNEVLRDDVRIVNLSIGGPDFLDFPFMDKIEFLAGRDVIIVSAVGNDGPICGSIHNPADSIYVIGVGAIDENNSVADYSSCGPTLHQIIGGSLGFPIIKPDLLALGSVQSLNENNICSNMTGTSMAAPIVTSAIALALSINPSLNLAAIKQLLYESSDRLPNVNIFKQGAGALNIHKFISLVHEFESKVTSWPSSLDLFASQYYGNWSRGIIKSSVPFVFNFTLLNSVEKYSKIAQVPTVTLKDHETNARFEFEYPKHFGPYVSYLTVRIYLNSSKFDKLEGKISVKIEQSSRYLEELTIPFVIPVIESHDLPRVLFDEFHSLQYPFGYFPADSLGKPSNVPFDWHGDSLLTNFNGLIRELGDRIQIESISFPAFCVNLDNYDCFLIVDAEDTFSTAEIDFIEKSVEQGLHLIIFADWFNHDLIEKAQVLDKQTGKYWYPFSGGCNIPALNLLLERFGMAFSDQTYSGSIPWPNGSFEFDFGNSITKFPNDGLLFSVELHNEVSQKIEMVSVFGTAKYEKGLVSIFGDSNCLDDIYNSESDCYGLLDILLQAESLEDIIDNIPWPLGKGWNLFDRIPQVHHKSSQLLETITKSNSTCSPKKTNFHPFTPNSSDFHNYRSVDECCSLDKTHDNYYIIYISVLICIATLAFLWHKIKPK